MRGLGAAAATAGIVFSGGGAAIAADVKVPPANAPVAETCTSVADFFTTGCHLTLYGVRFYGAIDGGYGYQTNGAPFEKLASSAVNIYLGKSNLGGKFLPSPNVLSLSNVGLEIKEPLGVGWSFVGRVETQFDPYALKILNGPRSVYNNIGVPLALQTSAGDSNSQGAFYDGQSFAGVSNDFWGALTFGRQSTLMADALLAYDPQARAAVSPLGFFGSYAGGGDTENSKATTSVKYRVMHGNYRFGVFGQFGGYNEGNASRGAIQGDVGADFNVGSGLFSTTIIGSYTKDAVTVGLSGPVNIIGYPVAPFTSTSEVMGATLSDNTSVMAVAKYTVDRLKLYVGYQLTQFANPSDPYTVAGTGFTDISGDFVCFSCSSINGTNITSAAYTKHKIQQLVWFGGTYALTPSLDLTTAYYHVSQNEFSNGARNGAGGTCAVAATALFSCAGSLDSASIVLDWKFAPKWDTYIATVYERLNGGLDSGYLADNNWSTMAGLRFRW
jgi:predicted porin